ncbi:hypothetical protein ACT8ZS_22460 [Paenibacillus sp. M.A.Huq-84]
MHKTREITELAVPLSLCFSGYSGDKGTTLPLLSFASGMLRGVRPTAMHCHSASAGVLRVTKRNRHFRYFVSRPQFETIAEVGIPLFWTNKRNLHKNRVITELTVPLSLCFLRFPGDKGITLPLLSFTALTVLLTLLPTPHADVQLSF